MRQRASQQFPVASMRCGNDKSLARCQLGTHLIHSTRQSNILSHILLDDRRPQYFKKHGAKAQRALLGNAFCFLLFHMQAIQDLLLGQALPLSGHKGP